MNLEKNMQEQFLALPNLSDNVQIIKKFFVSQKQKNSKILYDEKVAIIKIFIQIEDENGFHMLLNVKSEMCFERIHLYIEIFGRTEQSK